MLAVVRNEPLVVGCSDGGSCALEVARAGPHQARGTVLEPRLFPLFDLPIFLSPEAVG
jgi:hypothetical protein